MNFCKGDDRNIITSLTEGKVWRGDDLYLVKCSKCGSTDRVISNRPHEILMKCGFQEC